MTSQGFALARAELIRALTAYSGITTADGADDGTTIIDTNLIGLNDFITEKTVVIMSGAAAMEDKGAASFDNTTGTITLQGVGFSAQITAGTIFRVLNISSVEIDVATINTKIGTNVDAAGTTTVFARLKQIVDTYLANATIGLAAIKTVVDAILLDTGTTLETKLDNIKTVVDAILIDTGTTLEGKLDAIGTIVAAILVDTGTTLDGKLDAIAGYLDTEITAILAAVDTEVASILAYADPKVMGRLQIKATTIDLNQAAATYVLFTANTQDVVVEKLVIRMSGGALAAPFTSLSIQTDDATPQIFISAVQGAVGNLTNEAQLAWTGAILLDAGSAATIGLTIAVAFGGLARVCDVIAEYRAVIAGGLLL